jgi:diguanylate cyclase (GGDEF)-like protein
MVNDLLEAAHALAWPDRMPLTLQRQRAHEIVTRVRVFAVLVGVLTVAWIAVDAMVLVIGPLILVAIARIATGAALAILALSCRMPAPTPRQARARLVALFLIPAAFFLVTAPLLPQAPVGWPHGILAAYSYVPFALAAGIGAFPLALGESAFLAAILFAVEARALLAGGIAAPSGGPESLWLLFLIVAAAGFAAASQLRLMTALVEQAVRDPLTGCLRRESGAELLEAQFLLAVRQAAPLAVLFADIDRFKAVNDAFGHDAGDRVLAATAQALRGMARESDVLIRWGGEEFVVVLHDAASTEAVTLIQRLRERGLGTQPDGRPVTVSIGVAEYRGDSVESASELVALADQRMYLAKQAGRNRYVLDASAAAHPIVASAEPGR